MIDLKINSQHCILLFTVYLKMNKKAILCILYTTLLIIPATILGRDANKKEKKAECSCITICSVRSFDSRTSSIYCFGISL